MKRHRQSSTPPVGGRSVCRLIAAGGFLALASASHALDQGKFEPLHRAARTMAAATAKGASYERFSELARGFAEALLAARENVATDEERALLLLYAQAGLAYGDSLAFLREKAANEGGYVPASASDIAPLVTRYAIATAEDDVDADSALRVIWARADEALHRAELLYQGRAEELAAIMGTDAAAPAAQAPVDDEHRRELIERVAREFEESDQTPARPRPFEVTTGNWTCPRGYVVRRGECLSDEDLAHLPKVEVGR